MITLKGLLIHHGDQSIARYKIKKLNGTPYMFLEWMSGDVIHRKMKPKYYVLKKIKQ